MIPRDPLFALFALLAAAAAISTPSLIGTSTSKNFPRQAQHAIMSSEHDKKSPTVPPTDAHPARSAPKIKILHPSSSSSSPSSSSLPKTPPAKDNIPHDKYAPQPQTSVSLSDTIGPHRSISSFSSFTRMNASLAVLLADLSANLTVLAPLNSAIDSLSRKPWEGSSDDTDGADGPDRASRNMDTFMRAHLLGVAPWREGQKVKTLGGREIWWEGRAGVRVVCPDGIEVERVGGRVGNGELWILKGVLKYT
ncbi:hypothetical protein E4U57_000728 [Claviceps arundinis]|uniref:FAS1 domain-containing protein n=1 Tax=Claviceps arundinis TaxID=1623583 RepID=A0A9P7MYY0_9HYPO|nr:hypothetical protein E4U57_000728 [Claviceps arundinis]KAG5977326.1 hypothetical protein E4U56_008152 [Claviceps arundinis]